MKRILAICVCFVMVLCVVCSSEASYTYRWLPAGINIYLDVPLGTTIEDYQVTEIEYARYGRDGNTWQGNSIPGSGVWGGNGQVWLFRGDVWATFSIPSTTIAFEAEGDYNDGITDFYVDNQLIASQDMRYYLGHTLLIEGLEDIVHTVRVVGTTHLNGAYALSPISSDPPQGTPEPATMTLMGLGLIMLGVFGKKFRKNNLS